MTAPALGVSLYSFTSAWVTGRCQLSDLMRTVAEAGIGPGLELVGFQSLRGFPRLDDETVRRVRA